MHDRKGVVLGSRQSRACSPPRNGRFSGLRSPMQQKGLACMACSHVGKGWAAGWVRGEITFLAFPTAAAGVRAQTPEPKVEGLGWIWGDKMEQGDPRAKMAWDKRLHW